MKERVVRIFIVICPFWLKTTSSILVVSGHGVTTRVAGRPTCGYRWSMRTALLSLLVAAHFLSLANLAWERVMAQRDCLTQLRGVLASSGVPCDAETFPEEAWTGELEAARALLSHLAAAREVEGVIPDIAALVGEVSSACRGLVARLAGLALPPRPPEALPQGWK